MDIEKVINREEGRIYLYNWQCYFAEIVRSHKYECVSTEYAQIIIENGYCFLLDKNNEMIWESCISVEDFEAMADIVWNKMLLYNGWQHDRIPRFKIGLEVAERFRAQKRKKAEEKQRKAEESSRKRELLEEMRRVDECKDGDLYVSKAGNEWVEMGLAEQNRKSLWMNLWREREICFLFADSNIGKSIYALQIAFHIAKEQKVIYFDYEMDYKEFQSRYTGATREAYVMPEGFIRCEPNRDIFLDKYADELLLRAIEKVVVNEGAKVIVIDNLTYLSKNAQSGVSVSVLMYRLKMLQRKHGLSILVLAHTPKRDMRRALTQNDLAGSKKLFNFADSGFAIGQSVRDDTLQYVKQLKARGGRIEYGAENVILVERVFTDNWLHFEVVGYDKEVNHLKERKEDERARLAMEVDRLREEGLSLKETALMLKISTASVKRLMKRG